MRNVITGLAMVTLSLAVATGAKADMSYQEILSKYTDENSAGVAVIVKKGDKVLFHEAEGKANIELDVSLDENHIFRIGSITKQFTAAAILMLHEQGKLSIYDNIHKYVPDFPTEGNEVKLVHLLSHTSGINNYTNNRETFTKRIQELVSTDEMLALFAKEPMLFKTGEQYGYSNTGYVLLGKVIEEVSKQSYGNFVKDHIFKKLDMKNSHYGGRQIIPNRASGYSKMGQIDINAALIDMSWPHAAGALLSTVEDLAKWNEALSSGKVISKENYELMTTGFTLNDGSQASYGFGLGTGKVGAYKSVGHGGGIPGFSTDSIYIPEKDVFVAAFANSDSISPSMILNLMAAKALDIEVPAFKEVTIDDKKVGPLLGKYELEGGGVRAFTLKNGKLFTQRDNGRLFEVKAMSENSFYYPDSLVYFDIEKEAGSYVMKFYRNLDNTPAIAKKI